MLYYLNKNNEETKSLYITDVNVVNLSESKRNPVQSFSVTYANGDVEDNIEFTDENARKIDTYLVKQVCKGGEARHKLVRKMKLGTIGRISAGAALSAASAYAINVMNSDEPLVALGAAGVICLGGIILGIKNYKTYNPMVEELDDNIARLRKRKAAREYLKASPNSYLALDGQNEEEKIARAGEIFDMMVDGRDPFSLLSLETEDGLTNQEIDSLLSHRAREEKLGFTYAGGYAYRDVAKQYSKK